MAAMEDFNKTKKILSWFNLERYLHQFQALDCSVEKLENLTKKDQLRLGDKVIPSEATFKARRFKQLIEVWLFILIIFGSIYILPISFNSFWTLF